MLMYSTAPSASFVLTFHNSSSYTLNYGIDISCVECQLALPFAPTVGSFVHLELLSCFLLMFLDSCSTYANPLPDEDGVVLCLQTFECERKGEESEKWRRRELMERAVVHSCTLAESFYI